MVDKAVPARTGRPRKFPGEGTRLPHSVRLKAAIAEKLRTEAASRGRSVAEELELRIDNSFLQEGMEDNFVNKDMNYVVAHIDSRIHLALDEFQKSTISRMNILTVDVLESFRDCIDSFREAALQNVALLRKEALMMEAMDNTISHSGSVLHTGERLRAMAPALDRAEAWHLSLVDVKNDIDDRIINITKSTNDDVS